MSGGDRKFGRCKNRPSNKNYTTAQRWIKNKKLSIRREAIRVARAAIRKLLRKPEQSRDNARIVQLRKTIEQLKAA